MLPWNAHRGSLKMFRGYPDNKKGYKFLAAYHKLNLIEPYSTNIEGL